MLSIEKNIIKYLRKETGCPYWSIVACLKIYDWDIDKTINRLKDIYCVWGDNPSIQIKHDEDILREEYKQKIGNMDRQISMIS